MTRSRLRQVIQQGQVRHSNSHNPLWFFNLSKIFVHLSAFLSDSGSALESVCSRLNNSQGTKRKKTGLGLYLFVSLPVCFSPACLSLFLPISPLSLWTSTLRMMKTPQMKSTVLMKTRRTTQLRRWVIRWSGDQVMGAASEHLSWWHHSLSVCRCSSVTATVWLLHLGPWEDLRPQTQNTWGLWHHHRWADLWPLFTDILTCTGTLTSDLSPAV